MHSNKLNSKIISLGENLRNRYLYGMQEDKDILSFLIVQHKKKQTIKDKIINIIQCH